MINKLHIPVLINEAVLYMKLAPGQTVIDATFGRGGHSRAILDQIGPEGKLIAIDQDEDALQYAALHFKDEPNLFPIQSNFMCIKDVFEEWSSTQKKPPAGIDAILFDLGVSSPQINEPERGFSFQWDGPLDMRMNRNTATTAGDLVNTLSCEELTNIIKEYGEERYAVRIANAIVSARQNNKRIETTGVLSNIIKHVIPQKDPMKRRDSVMRTFQSLRIAVNQELESLKRALQDAVSMLNPGGRIVAISFHSLEDRIVKTFFNTLAKGCTCPSNFPKCVCGKEPTLKVLTRKPVLPTREEIKNNSRAACAKLRAAEKI
ncbi:MAG: 16S rRNA (cytosine(1402)-N(4))-methyltransferase RsmH [Candidatus Margulisiibacteriota bacterium]